MLRGGKKERKREKSAAQTLPLHLVKLGAFESKCLYLNMICNPQTETFARNQICGHFWQELTTRAALTYAGSQGWPGLRVRGARAELPPRPPDVTRYTTPPPPTLMQFCPPAASNCPGDFLRQEGKNCSPGLSWGPRSLPGCCPLGRTRAVHYWEMRGNTRGRSHSLSPIHPAPRPPRSGSPAPRPARARRGRGNPAPLPAPRHRRLRGRSPL